MKRTTTRSAITCGAALWLLGCGSAPAPESPARRSAAPAPAPRPAAPAAPALGSAPASPFFVVGELHGDLSLYGAGDRGFLISAGGIELQLIGDEIVQDPILKRGLPFLTEAFLAVDGVGGRYPDALWLSTTQPQGRGGFSSLWRWDGKNWRRQEAMNDMHYIYGIQPWVGGRMLALEQSGVAFEASFRVLSGDGRIALPEFTKSPPKKKSDDDGSFSFCITQLKPEVWATLPSGEVFAVGPRCDSAELYQELAVERWAAGARRSNIDIPAGIH
ncbi:MAG TPA: hypothetical protein VEQ59_08305, partial [Polyangiaceae bacterium]|nr:hypothetical protein [Polyangiaceae bacterium]